MKPKINQSIANFIICIAILFISIQLAKLFYADHFIWFFSVLAAFIAFWNSVYYANIIGEQYNFKRKLKV